MKVCFRNTIVCCCCLLQFFYFAALKDQKEKNGALFSSIISAAQRKVKRKTVKSGHCTTDGKEEPTTPNGVKEFTYQAFSPTDLKQVRNFHRKRDDLKATRLSFIGREHQC